MNVLLVLDNIAMAKSGPGQAAVTVQPSLFDMFYEEFLTQFMSAAADPNEISQAELQTKFREDFTRMKVPTSHSAPLALGAV